jgi:ABC-type transport system involved in multi-copper enzyme maturation permease subunit
VSPRSSLVSLFLRDLIRRRTLWVLATILAGVVAFNLYISDQTQQFEQANRVASTVGPQLAGSFTQLAEAIHYFVLLFVSLLALLVAPESRRNGTTQFLLTLPISRGRIARAQLAAIAILIGASVLILHVGIGYGGWRIGAMSATELWLSWIPLLVMCLLQALPVFALSTSMSATATLIIILVVPILLAVTANALAAFRSIDATLPIRLIEHARFLFPDLSSLLAWPRVWLSYQVGDVPATSLRLLFVHQLCAVAFWTLAGLLRYRRYEFGSRTLLR